MFWLVAFFCRFKVKDGVTFLVSGLLPRFPWGLLGVDVGLSLLNTVAGDLAVSEDPVFLAWGLR